MSYVTTGRLLTVPCFEEFCYILSAALDSRSILAIYLTHVFCKKAIHKITSLTGQALQW